MITITVSVGIAKMNLKTKTFQMKILYELRPNA